MTSNKESLQTTDSQTTTERVSIYCDASTKQQWTAEAEATGYSSRSTYLLELIQESRRYRKQGFLSREQKHDEIRRLEAEVDRLKTELANTESQHQALIQAIEDPELVKQVLSTQFSPLCDITEAVLSQSIVAVDARDLIERALFQLAQRDQIEYKRGHGWRLTEGR